MNCTYCNEEQPKLGFFCPNCFKQTKCKRCEEALLKDTKICVFCGNGIENNNSSSNVNTIEFSETENERKFKASFTDTVGESISESFGLFMANNIDKKKSLPPKQSDSFEPIPVPETVIHKTDEQKTNSSDSDLGLKDIDIPSLNDVKMRDLAKNEIDWILVYIYFASKGGTKEFTRVDIAKLYKDTDRKTDNRIKSLSRNFNRVSKGLYIKSTNEKNFILLEKGQIRVIEIFKGKSQASSQRTKSKVKSVPKDIKGKKSKNNKNNNSIGFIDLKLSLKELQLLNEFYDYKKPSSQNEKVLVVVNWYFGIKQVKEISIAEINYLLSIVNSKPAALGQVLINMAGSNFRWIIKESEGKYGISSIGENHVTNNLPKDIK